MPYISLVRRRDIHQEAGRLSEFIQMNQIRSVGELNFAITTLVKDYLDLKGLSYQSLNEAIGVLECAKLELYRRLAVPYEDKKIEENGDVY